MSMPELREPAKIKAAATYNSAADHFDDAPLAFWDRYGRGTVERIGLKPGQSVLDVGCGTGASALPAAEIVGAEGWVLGVDLAEKLLEQAAAKAAAKGLTQAEFRPGDMSALGFADGHFDAVVSVFSIFFVPDMETQMAELWRMVKPGGVLAITTWGHSFWEPVYSVWREAIKEMRPDLYTAFNPWDRISQPDQLAKLFEDSGIPGAKIAPEEGVQTLRTADDWWTMVLGSGLRGTVDSMDAAMAAQLRDRTVGWARENKITAVQTNAIYGVARKVIDG
jgi:ubiquinone/menaquinone biosynthesis C-methylase UbiE